MAGHFGVSAGHFLAQKLKMDNSVYIRLESDGKKKLNSCKTPTIWLFNIAMENHNV